MPGASESTARTRRRRGTHRLTFVTNICLQRASASAATVSRPEEAAIAHIGASSGVLREDGYHRTHFVHVLRAYVINRNARTRQAFYSSGRPASFLTFASPRAFSRRAW